MQFSTIFVRASPCVEFFPTSCCCYLRESRSPSDVWDAVVLAIGVSIALSGDRGNQFVPQCAWVHFFGEIWFTVF